MTISAFSLWIWIAAAQQKVDTPTLKFVREGPVASIVLPEFVGFRVVTDPSAPANYTVHARLEKDVDGKNVMAVWLDPTISKENRVMVWCQDNGECRDHPLDEASISALFYQALDIALFMDDRGLGFMTIADCHMTEDHAEIDVVSAKHVGLDQRFHYVFSNYDSTGKRIVDSMQYELKLIPNGRRSATEGWFRGYGKTDKETMGYLKKRCPSNEYKPLLIQLRPPELRWETQAGNARSSN